jgi:SAM-dependent methyltransferase
MTSASPLATPEPWDLVADGYVQNVADFEAFAREALRLVPAAGQILDVAAGPGSLTLLAAHTATRVHAVDFAPAMLHALRARAAAAGITNVHTQLADAQSLPFPAGSFDVAYSMFGVIFFPDRSRGLAELARVLRPGGRVLVSSWPPAERIPVFAALLGALGAELPGSAFGKAPTALGTAAEVTAELGAAGFEDVEVHEHEVVPGTSAPAEIWRIFSRGAAPVALLRKKLGEHAFADLSARVVARLEQSLGPGPREVRLTALLGAATRPR